MLFGQLRCFLPFAFSFLIHLHIVVFSLLDEFFDRIIEEQIKPSDQYCKVEQMQ